MSRHDKITHNEVQSFLADYTAGELNEREQRRVHDHLQRCRTCQKALAEVQHIRALLHTLADPVHPTDTNIPGLHNDNQMPSLASGILARLNEPYISGEDELVDLNLGYGELDEDSSLESTTKENHDFRPLSPFPRVSRVYKMDKVPGNNTSTEFPIYYEHAIDKNMLNGKERDENMVISTVKFSEKAAGARRPVSILAAVIALALIAASVLATLGIIRSTHKPDPSPIMTPPVQPSTTPAQKTATVEATKNKKSGVFLLANSFLQKVGLDGKQLWRATIPGDDGPSQRRVGFVETSRVVYVYVQPAPPMSTDTTESPVYPAPIVYAFSAQNGTQLWAHEINNQGRMGYYMATANDEMFFFYNGYGTVEALSAKNGHTVWENTDGVEIVQTLASKMVVMQNWLSIAVMNVLYSVDTRNGKTAWKQTFENGLELGPMTIANNIIYATGWNRFQNKLGLLYAYRINGKQLWSVDNLPKEIFSSIVIVKDKIFLSGIQSSDGSSHIYTVDAKTGSQLWTIPINGYTNIAGGNDALYVVRPSDTVGTSDIEAFGVTENRSPLWVHKSFAGSIGMVSLDVVDNVIYVSTQLPTLACYAFQANNGSLLWSYEVSA